MEHHRFRQSLHLCLKLLNFLFFSDKNLNSNKNELLTIFINSTKYLLYIYYNNLKECNSLRDEDYYSIPLQNLGQYQKDTIINDLKNYENKLRNEMKGMGYVLN